MGVGRARRNGRETGHRDLGECDWGGCLAAVLNKCIMQVQPPLAGF